MRNLYTQESMKCIFLKQARVFVSVLITFLSVYLVNASEIFQKSRPQIELKEINYNYSSIRPKSAFITINQLELSKSVILMSATSLLPYYDFCEMKKRTCDLFIMINDKKYRVQNIIKHWGFSTRVKVPGHDFALVILEDLIPEIEPLSIDTSVNNVLNHPIDSMNSWESLVYIFLPDQNNHEYSFEDDEVVYDLDYHWNSPEKESIKVTYQDETVSKGVIGSEKNIFDEIGSRIAKLFFSEKRVCCSEKVLLKGSPVWAENFNNNRIFLIGLVNPDESTKVKEKDVIDVQYIYTMQMIDWIYEKIYPYVLDSNRYRTVGKEQNVISPRELFPRIIVHAMNYSI